MSDIDVLLQENRKFAPSEEFRREALLSDPRNPLAAVELDPLLDPLGYLGSAGELVDRALARYDSEGRS